VINPFGAAAGNTGELRLSELIANGSNYTGFKPPDLLLADVVYVLPDADGTIGQVLQTDGLKTLSWTTATGDVSGPGSSKINAFARWGDVNGTMFCVILIFTI